MDSARAAYGAGRLTAQRRAIARTVTEMHGAFTIEELVAVVRKAEPASTATSYRAVSAMEAAGFVERVGTRDGSVLFAHCGDTTHHHHIVCDRCGRIALAECPIEPDLTASSTGGFMITRHEVTLYGLCPRCVANESGS